MRIILITIILLAGAVSSSQAQFWKKKKNRNQANEQLHPSALNPLPKAGQYQPKAEKKRSSKSGPTYESEQQFYDRMEALAKEKRKIEKLMAKPQYSNPMYFGHKRPPKKRKPGKMKYCKECGIRH